MEIAPISKAIRRGLVPLAARDPLRLSQWAAEHFYLSAESSYVEQKWTAYPFQVALMDCMGHDDIAEVCFIKSARVGYTKMLLACIAYTAEHRRRNQAIWQPTDDDSDEFVKTDLEPMLRDVEVMRTVFPQYLARHKTNTLQQKKFIDSILFTKGAKAAKNFRRISVDNALLDEADAMDQDVEKEGSPYRLAKKRTEGATFPKIIVGSTPKLKGFSLVEERYERADARYRFHIPCPCCDEFIELTWGGPREPHGFKWAEGDPDSVVHQCIQCGDAFSQADYLSVWHRGRWTDEDGNWIDADCVFHNSAGERITPPSSIAFHIWTAYSPQTTWAAIVREFLDAYTKLKAGDTSLMKTFVNTTLGQTWEEEVEKTDDNELKKRAEAYPLRTVPMGGLVLVAGVDVQANRFEVVVWAIGRHEEMWVVDYHVIDANPADERDWDEKLDPYLSERFRHAAGQLLGIEALAIDTGGHYTHQAYNYVRERERARPRVYAVKGEHRAARPIKGSSSLQDVNRQGKVIKRGVRLWLVGTDTAKDLLFGRLQVRTPGAGSIHFSDELPDEFYAQLTAEVRVLQKTATGDQYRWVKRRKRNEVLDCTVYALFAAQCLDLHRYTDKMWDKQADAVCPPVGDLFASAMDVAPPPRPAAVLPAVSVVASEPQATPVAVSGTTPHSPPKRRLASRLA